MMGNKIAFLQTAGDTISGFPLADLNIIWMCLHKSPTVKLILKATLELHSLQINEHSGIYLVKSLIL